MNNSTLTDARVDETMNADDEQFLRELMAGVLSGGKLRMADGTTIDFGVAHIQSGGAAAFCPHLVIDGGSFRNWTIEVAVVTKAIEEESGIRSAVYPAGDAAKMDELFPRVGRTMFGDIIYQFGRGYEEMRPKRPVTVRRFIEIGPNAFSR